MDVETVQAVEALGSRIDRVETQMKDGFADLRGEMRAEFASVRAEMREEFLSVRTEIAELRQEVRTGLESNWTRTQALFQDLQGDVRLLAGHVADLASRIPRS
jgi:ATP/maltotriose-dependent transcriptional regulator MalT